jgi:hypothetical protein
MHETALTRDISTPCLVPPPRSKSKIASHFSLGPIAPFVANLRGEALARQSTCLMCPHRPMFSRDIEGAPVNNTNNVNKRPHLVRALGWARHPREDGPRRSGTKQTKQIRKATSPLNI